MSAPERQGVEEEALEVWDGSVPPGGFVCAVCGMPVESEPCAEHGAAFVDAVARKVHSLKFPGPNHRDCPPTEAALRSVRLHILALPRIPPPEVQR